MNKQKPLVRSSLTSGSVFDRTPGRNRTGTYSRISVFETDASTNSATGAKWECKGNYFCYSAKLKPDKF